MSWNESFFNLFYQELFMSRTQERLEYETSLIAQITSMKPSDSIADFCCGIGDLLNTFSQKGYDAYGVDFSDEYVQAARNRFNLDNVFKGDALTYDFNKQFDVAINWYSSFGYFDDQSNQVLLNNIHCQLKPGGRFVLEIFNSYDIIRTYTDKLEYDKSYQGKNVHVIRQSKLDLEKREIHQEWDFEYEGNIQHYSTTNKIYFIDDIINKMKMAGFKNISCFESPTYDIILNPATLDSKRLLFIGEK